MDKSTWKEIKEGDNIIHITRHARYQLIKDTLAKESRAYLNHKGRRYYLDEFMTTCHASGFLSEYDGYTSDSFFSGVAVKFNPDFCDEVKAITFIC